MVDLFSELFAIVTGPEKPNTYYERNTDAEAKELQKIGLLDKYRNYTFWDNFPDNWKLSDEELEALDYEDED